MQTKLTQTLVRQAVAEPGKRVELWDTVIPGLHVRVGNRTKNYYLRYSTPNGPRRNAKIGSAEGLSLAQARDIARSIIGDVAKGEDPAAKAPTRDIPLHRYLEEYYIPWVVKNKKAGQNTAIILRNFIEFFGRNKMISDLCRQDIEMWREEMRTRGNKAASINRKYGALRAALNWGVEMEILPCSPLVSMRGIKTLKETDSEEKIRYLSEEEEERLYGALKERDLEIRQKRRKHNEWCLARGRDPWPDLDNVAYADSLEPMITVSLKTGVRRSALFRLEWKDIDFIHQVLTVRAEICKTGKSRKIPLSATALDTLGKWREQQSGKGLVFPSPKTGGVMDNCNSAWAALLKDAGIEGFRWHDLRHTFASRLVINGADLNVVRELLGHSDLKMTLRYAHLAPNMKSRTIELLG